MFKENLDIFFNDFSVNAYTENGECFKVLFNNEYLGYTPFSRNFNIESQEYSIDVKNEDINKFKLQNKDILKIENMTFKIKVIKFSGFGISNIEILKVEDD